jgi:TPR repeat protein
MVRALFLSALLAGAHASAAPACSAVDECVRACDSGSKPEACSELAKRAYRGEGIPRDRTRALALYRRACELHSSTGCNQAGLLTARGIGGAPNAEAAIGFFQRGCLALEGGKSDADACANWGTFFQRGKGGVERNDVRAVALFQRACDAGSATGCANLGFMAAEGRGTPKDDARAVQLYKSSCEAGSPVGCSNLGSRYDRGVGVPRSVTKAIDLFRRACDRGSASGCSNLGLKLELGEGVKQNLEEALALYQRACDADSPLGCTNLGLLYLRGRGVSPDRTKATALLRQGCEGGDGFACEQLKRFEVKAQGGE